MSEAHPEHDETPIIRRSTGGCFTHGASYSFARFDARRLGIATAAAVPPCVAIAIDAFTTSLMGVGSAVEVPAVFGTLLAFEWGYGFRRGHGGGTLGTQVFRVSGDKVF